MPASADLIGAQLVDGHRIRLETERMVLRETRDEDIDMLMDLDSDPEVRRYVRPGEPVSRSEMEREVMPRLTSHPNDDRDLGYWVAHRRVDGLAVGFFLLRPDKLLGEPMELGYRLYRADWGQGLATEGTRALIEDAFQRMGLPALTASVLEANRASARVLEKVGMHLRERFVCPPDWLPDTDDAQRAAVRYWLDLDGYPGDAS